MKSLLRHRSLFITAAVVVIGIVVFMMVRTNARDSEPRITATVETGAVRQLVSVSGIAESNQTAELAFPQTGIVANVFVKKGDVVSAGGVLIELERAALAADRLDAVAALSRASAARDELIAGPRDEAKIVTSETVILKEQALATTKDNEARKIENARRTLLSSGLEAEAVDSDEDAPAPTISGTYTCDEEGVYEISVYSSSAESGYSYRIRGLEFGTYTGSVEQPTALGACGLRIQFAAGASYGNTEWTIAVPNTQSFSYVTNLNAYNLAKTQAESAISLAEQEVTLAEATAVNTNAPARSEAVARANADIAQAQAQVARIDAQIADRILTAPFDGVITDIDILPGETVGTTPVVTLLAGGAFELTARIPEIDISKLLIGQKAEVLFDANDSVPLTATVDFVSLKSTEIDGVAYYEARLKLDEEPVWLRSGLNADVDIIIEETTALRLPIRFVSTDETSYTVLITRDGGLSSATTTVDITLFGNDGFVAVSGLTSGDVVVAP